MQITTDALELDLHIYQNNAGHVQVFNFISENPKKVVHVKFTHDDQYPLGNYYDAITNVQPDINIRLLSQVAETVHSIQKEPVLSQEKWKREMLLILQGMMGTVMRLSYLLIWIPQGISVGGIQPPLPHLHPQQTPKVILHIFQLRCLLSFPTQHPLYLSPHQLSNRCRFHLQESLSSISSVIMTVIWTVSCLVNQMMKSSTFSKAFLGATPFLLGTSIPLSHNM